MYQHDTSSEFVLKPIQDYGMLRKIDMMLRSLATHQELQGSLRAISSSASLVLEEITELPIVTLSPDGEIVLVYYTDEADSEDIAVYSLRGVKAGVNPVHFSRFSYFIDDRNTALVCRYTGHNGTVVGDMLAKHYHFSHFFIGQTDETLEETLRRDLDRLGIEHKSFFFQR